MRAERSYFRSCFLMILLTLSPFVLAQDASDVALITALNGAVSLVSPQGKQPLQAFVKLKRGDLLSLANARIRLIYFESGKQEVWQGSGRLEILTAASRAFGLSDPETRIVNSSIAKQIARAPSLDSQGQVVAVRVRAIASPEAIAKLEDNYRRMRMETVRGDLSPELYLLSGLFEMRELARVEQILRDLQQAHPGDVEVGLMAALYKKALRNVQESRGN